MTASEDLSSPMTGADLQPNNNTQHDPAAQQNSIRAHLHQIRHGPLTADIVPSTQMFMDAGNPSQLANALANRRTLLLDDEPRTRQLSHEPSPDVRLPSARYTSPLRPVSFAHQPPQHLPIRAQTPSSPRWGIQHSEARGVGLPSVEQVIAATKAAVPPINSICARLSSPLHIPSQPLSHLPQDVLRVTLRTARDLLDNRGRIQGDFYAKLSLGTSHNYESQIVYGTFSPSWNEGFCFDMQTEDGDGMLEVNVLDRHNSPEDYLVGVACLDLYALHPALLERGTVEVVLGLTNQGVHVGSVDVVVAPVHRSQLERPSTQQALNLPSPQLIIGRAAELSEVSSVNSEPVPFIPAFIETPASPVRTSPPRSMPHPTNNVVRLTVINYEFPRNEEAPKDCPPSIRLSLGARHHRFELQGHGPHGTFMVDLYQEQLSDDAVQVTAMEKHAVCGQGRLPLMVLKDLPISQSMDCRVPLLWMSAPAGALILRAERLSQPLRVRPGALEGTTSTKARSAGASQVPHSTPLAWCGTIRVTISEADIATKKSVRFMDPYVRLKFGKTSCETAVQYGSMNPVGFHEAFDLYHPSGAGSVLEVHLMDKKQIGADDPIGRGFVDLLDFLEDRHTRSMQCDAQMVRHGSGTAVVRITLAKVAERAEAGRGLGEGHEHLQVMVQEAHQLHGRNLRSAQCCLRLQMGDVEHHTSTRPLTGVIVWREGFLFDGVQWTDNLAVTAIAEDDKESLVVGSGRLDIQSVVQQHGGVPLKVPLYFQKRPAGFVVLAVTLHREVRTRKILQTRPLRSSSAARPHSMNMPIQRRLSSEPSNSRTRSAVSVESRTPEPWDTFVSEPEPPSHHAPVPLNQLRAAKRQPSSEVEDDFESEPQSNKFALLGSARDRQRRATPPSAVPAFGHRHPWTDDSGPEGMAPEVEQSMAPQGNGQAPLYGPFIPAGRALASPRCVASGSTRFGALSHSHHVYAQ